MKVTRCHLCNAYWSFDPACTGSSSVRFLPPGQARGPGTCGRPVGLAVAWRDRVFCFATLPPQGRPRCGSFAALRGARSDATFRSRERGRRIAQARRNTRTPRLGDTRFPCYIIRADVEICDGLPTLRTAAWLRPRDDSQTTTSFHRTIRRTSRCASCERATDCS